MLINSIKSIIIRRMKKKIGFNYRGEEIVLEAREMRGLKKFVGMMFYRSLLLFDFGKDSQTKIHSLFCPKFLAVWIDSDDNVVDLKIVEPWKFSVSSKKAFSKLIEIPINEKYRELVEKLVP